MPTPQVVTVLGPIAPEAMGNTLTHDHVLIDAFGLFGDSSYAWILDDEDVMARELERFRDAGFLNSLYVPHGIPFDVWQIPEDRNALREAREEIWERKLETAAKAVQVSLEKLPGRKSAPEKVVLAALLKQTTSVSNGWLARRLGFAVEDEIVAVFCGSKKTLASGVPMARLLFAGNPVLGTVVLPIMFYHQLQLFVCAVLARRYAARTAG